MNDDDHIDDDTALDAAYRIKMSIEQISRLVQRQIDQCQEAKFIRPFLISGSND